MTFSPGMLALKNRKADERMKRAAMGIVQPPLQRPIRFEIPRNACMIHNHLLMQRLGVLLHEIGPFEIVYDWCTAGGNATRPGHHIYEIVTRAGVSSMDELNLVMSLQEDDMKPWPNGHPIFPRESVVDMLKKRLHPDSQIDIDEFNAKAQAEADKPVQEAMEDLQKDLATYTRAGVNRDNIGTRLSRQKRTFKTPKVAVAVP